MSKPPPDPENPDDLDLLSPLSQGMSTTSSGSSDVGEGHEEEEDDDDLETAMLYGLYSYAAVLFPVAAAMVLSSLATVFINTDEYNEASASSFSQVYQVYSTDDSNEERSNASLLGRSVVNALVIVCGIGAMTFVIVALYYFKCIKCLGGFITLSSLLLLTQYTAMMWSVAIAKYDLNVDIFTFWFCIANFAVLGVVSIFFAKKEIAPKQFAQMYAVAISILMAWQLSHFEAWTGWTLLVVLGFYDLCAVLTPCGPLKALVTLLQKDQEEDGGRGMIPGLLYEASVPVRGGRNAGNGDGGDHGSAQSKDEGDDDASSPPPPPPAPRGPLPIPLALALCLRIPLISPSEIGGPSPYTAAQKMKVVQCVRPANMLFSRNVREDGEVRYFVRGTGEGNPTTCYYIDSQGRVFVEEEENSGDDEDEDWGR